MILIISFGSAWNESGERPSERIAGILAKIPEKLQDAIMRVFARREQIA